MIPFGPARKNRSASCLTLQSEKEKRKNEKTVQHITVHCTVQYCKMRYDSKNKKEIDRQRERESETKLTASVQEVVKLHNELKQCVFLTKQNNVHNFGIDTFVLAKDKR